MTTYTKRDLRAADLLALVLFGIGLVLTVIALLQTIRSQDSILTWIGAVCTLSLGTALNLKVRQLVRNRGQEPEEYEGVPE